MTVTQHHHSREDETMKNTRPKRATFPDRQRFNWGFHDGASDAKTGRCAVWNRGPVAAHHDPIYVIGYWAGQDTVKAGESTSDSEPAWLASRKES